MDYVVRTTKRAQRISLKIDHRGLVIVTPRKISASEVENLIEKHNSWITRHIGTIRAQAPKLYDGAEVELFGDKERITYALLENGTKPKIEENPEGITVLARPGEHSDVLNKWLRKTAKSAILARTQELAEKFGFKYNKISVRDQSSRWGSCSSKKNLNFSWRLMFAPLHIMDYVIIHELAHTRQMNHSPAFWQEVENCMADFKQARNWLKQNGNQLKMY